MTEAEHLNGLLAVELLQSGVDVYMQILNGIVVVHIDGNIKLNSADGIDYLLCGVYIYDRVFINTEAEHILKSRL